MGYNSAWNFFTVLLEKHTGKGHLSLKVWNEFISDPTKKGLIPSKNVLKNPLRLSLNFCPE